MTYLAADLRAARAVGARQRSIPGRPLIDETHVPTADPAPVAKPLLLLTARAPALNRAAPEMARTA